MSLEPKKGNFDLPVTKIAIFSEYLLSIMKWEFNVSKPYTRRVYIFFRKILWKIFIFLFLDFFFDNWHSFGTHKFLTKTQKLANLRHDLFGDFYSTLNFLSNDKQNVILSHS